MSTTPLLVEDKVEPGASTGETPKSVRLSVNLSPEVAEALKTLTGVNQLTLTEGVRRAVSIWKVLDEAIRTGQKIEVFDPKTKRTKELVLL